MQHMALIGLDLGATKLSGAIFETDGILLHKESTMLDKLGGDSTGRLVGKMLALLLEYARKKGLTVEAAGCCVPGLVFADTGRVWAPNIPLWKDYPLLDVIRDEIGNHLIRIVVDNDRTCSILGETWQGSARDFKNAVFLAVGTGIGAGILADGRIIRGAHEIAGAVGWLALDRPYREKYKSCGCFEYHASGEGLAKVTRELLHEDKDYTGVLRDKSPDQITAYDVFDAFKIRDKIAMKVIGQAVEFWGMTAANLVSLFDPEIIIFGGGVFGPASTLLDEIRDEAKKWAQPVSMQKVLFRTSLLGADAGLYGSAFLGLAGKSF
jgi:glucokinase